MIKTIVIDKNENALNFCTNCLKNFPFVNFLGGFDEFIRLKDFDFSTIDLIIFDISSKNSKSVFNFISEIKKKNPSICFIALSSEISSFLVNKLKEFEIKEFILKPVLENILETSIKKCLNKEDKKAKTISFFSLKGAVGKTTCANHIAYLLSQKTADKTCVLDLNFNSPDVNNFLNLEQKEDFNSLIKNMNDISSNDVLNFCARYKNSNLYTFSCAQEMAFSRYTMDTVIKVISIFKNTFDYLIIDMNSVIDERNISILNSSDLIFLVGLLNMQHIKNLQKCFEMFGKIGYSEDKVKLLINRYVKNSEISIEEAEKILDKKVFYKIPNNYLTLIDAINQGRLTQETNPQSNIARIYREITDEILKIDFLELSKANSNLFNNGILSLLKRTGE